MRASYLGAALIVAACIGSPVRAAPAPGALQDGETQAHLISASTPSMSTVIDGRMWQCTASDCSASPSDSAESQSAMRECRRAARVLGPFDVYRTGSHNLDSSELQACNPGSNKR